MRPDRRLVALPIVLLLAAAPDDDRPEPGRLRMSRAIPCEAIHGYGDIVPLDDPALTNDEKLQLYFEPTNYEVERSKQGYRIHLTQEGRLRRRGEKATLWKKEEFLKYEAKTKGPPGPIYLINRVALKGLKPGEYDFDITLHDKIADTTATQTVKFRVRPTTGEEASKDDEKADAKPGPEPEAAPPKRD